MLGDSVACCTIEANRVRYKCALIRMYIHLKTGIYNTVYEQYTNCTHIHGGRRQRGEGMQGVQTVRAACTVQHHRAIQHTGLLGKSGIRKPYLLPSPLLACLLLSTTTVEQTWQLTLHRGTELMEPSNDMSLYVHHLINSEKASPIQLQTVYKNCLLN